MALLGRDTSITSPDKDVQFLLETFQGTEAIGRPYRYDLTLLSDNPNIPVGKVLGQSLTVCIRLDTGQSRYFHGMVSYFAKTGLTMRHTRYAAVLTPRLTWLDYARDCRIFNDASNFDPDPETRKSQKNALDIINEVMEGRQIDKPIPDSIKDHVYRDRKYCVQYRETDLNFVQRLLEDEGIYYFFTHEDGKHTMVLAESTAAHAPAPGYESVLFLPKERKQAREEEHFWSLRVSGSLYQGRYTVLRGYDHTQPRPQAPQREDSPSSEKVPGATFEDYDYPGGLSAGPEAKEEATTRAQVDHLANTIIEVEGNTMGLGVGHLVQLRKPISGDSEYNPFWDEQDFTKKFIITSATYSITVDQYETGDVAGSDEPFKAVYSMVDSQTQLRPQRTAVKPRIEGPQTAIVVGASGDEIYTDKLGRVKVQFDWDRLGERDQKSSCWIRVSQVWAGKQWGAIHIPRVGQEVIVEFMDGDPDRPIITGRLYNADNMPPYTLPDNKTQSGIKSRSSKGGTASNFNEIRFEDLKGKEEFHIQAEKDMSTTVKNNQSTSVGADRSVSVSGNQSTTVTKNETQTYKAKRKMTVTDTNDDEVTGKHTGKYHSGREETVEKGDTLTVVSSNKTVTVQGTYGNTVKDEFKVTKGTTTMTITDDFVMEAKGKMDLHNAGTSVVGEGTTLTLNGNAEVKITCGSSSISLKSDGTIEITGKTVKIGNSTNNAAFEPAGTTINGVKITSAAIGIHEIVGALIKVG
jgi:type VI secretion system secreted protein VgrG